MEPRPDLPVVASRAHDGCCQRTDAPAGDFRDWPAIEASAHGIGRELKQARDPRAARLTSPAARPAVGRRCLRPNIMNGRLIMKKAVVDRARYRWCRRGLPGGRVRPQATNMSLTLPAWIAGDDLVRGGPPWTRARSLSKRRRRPHVVVQIGHGRAGWQKQRLIDMAGTSVDLIAPGVAGPAVALSPTPPGGRVRGPVALEPGTGACALFDPTWSLDRRTLHGSPTWVERCQRPSDGRIPGHGPADGLRGELGIWVLERS